LKKAIPDTGLTKLRKDRLQERSKFGIRHLARSHGGLAMLNLAETADMAGDRKVVGRVRNIALA
jgi:hypothetical protein